MRLRALAFLLLAGCSAKFFIAKDKAQAVKKVAVVQYAINPYSWLGPAATPEAKLNVAALNVETFAKELGNTYEVVSAVAHPAYAAAGGKPAWEGYYSGKDMHYFSADERALTEARLEPEVARKLCEALGVDAVVAIYDLWGVRQFAMNFKGHTLAEYTINVFDKTGERVWGGRVRGESETDFDTPNNIIATDVEVWTRANGESFKAALDQVKVTIGAK